MEKVRLAVVGLNFGKVHVRSILSDQVNAELAGVSDLNEAYEAQAAEWKVPFYQDYREMIRNEKPDGIVIAVPPNLHKDIGIHCMENGIHVFVEKPITYTPEDADQMIAAAKRCGVSLEVGHHHRFDPSVERARARIRSGDIGSLVGFHVFGVYPKLDRYFKDEWRLKRDSAGGPLISNGIHDIDRIRYVCGDIESITALWSNTHRGYEVEDTVAVSIKCANGAVGTYYLSDCSYVATEYTDFYFTSKASLKFTCSSMYSTVGRHVLEETTMDSVGQQYHLREKNVNTTLIPLQSNHLVEMEHFGRVIRGLEEPKTTGEEGKKSLQALLAIFESAEQQRTVRLNS